MCLIAAAALGSSGPAVAAEPDATITVTTVQDELNSSVPCSLREAIQAANQIAAVCGCPAGGSNAGCPATDQRSVARPQRGTCDIDAVEFNDRLLFAPLLLRSTT